MTEVFNQLPFIMLNQTSTGFEITSPINEMPFGISLSAISEGRTNGLEIMLNESIYSYFQVPGFYETLAAVVAKLIFDNREVLLVCDYILFKGDCRCSDLQENIAWRYLFKYTIKAALPKMKYHLTHTKDLTNCRAGIYGCEWDMLPTFYRTPFN